MNADAILGEVIKIVADASVPHGSQYDKLCELSAYIAALSNLDQGRVRNALIGGGWTKGDAKEFLADCAKTLRLQAATTKALVTDRPHSWPYDVDNGRLVLLSESAYNDGSVEVKAVPIADFSAIISEEGITEDGRKIYVITGDTIRSGGFVVDIDAEDFSDERKLKAALESGAGARDPVRAGMGKHLGPAIKLMTNGDLRRTHRFGRTGWCDDKFLIPGRTPADVTIRLSRKLPYSIDPDAKLELGLQAMESLMGFMTPQIGAVVFSHLLLAPMAAVAGWRNERCGLFIRGRTGTHKSSTIQAAMCLYGPAFMRDESLIKWGEGATRNAIMSYATCAHDMPLLIDNYKPSTGGGSHDFTNLVHNIMEGGDKERLTRTAQLRETKPIHTWPVFTGEDIPDNDPASIARVLVTQFTAGHDLELLSRAQELAPHLCAVGAAWLDWLESSEGQTIIKRICAEFETWRRQWQEVLTRGSSHVVNPLRVASNLATSWLTWSALCEHPSLGEFARKYLSDLSEGLNAVATNMMRLTSQSLEASRFVDALRELITGGRVTILRERTLSPEMMPEPRDRDRVIGWQADDGGAYILPDVTMTLLTKTTGLDLGGISRQTLYDQLIELGYLVPGKDRTAKVIKIAGNGKRLLHLTKAALYDE